MLVINADDFYGAAAYQAAADYFAAADASGTDYCMVGYRLRNTISPHGPVARGICRADAEAFLIEVAEVAGIQRDAAGEIQTTAPDGRRQRFSGEEIVSMNMWGFTPAVFPQLERLLVDFLRDRGGLSAAEFYIPAAVAALVRSRAARVKVLDAAGAEWIGADLCPGQGPGGGEDSRPDRRRGLSFPVVARRLKPGQPLVSRRFFR